MMKVKTSILPEINPSDIRKYLSKNIVFFKKNSTLFSQGSEPRGIYFIINGSVKISKIYKKEKECVLKIAGTNDIFGIEAFLKEIPYSATATVIEDSEICFISIKELNEIIKKNSFICFELLVKLYKYILTAEKRIFVLSYKVIEEKLTEIISEQKALSLEKAESEKLIRENSKKENNSKSTKQKRKANYFQLKIKQLTC